MGLLNSYEDEVFQLWNLSISKKMTNSLNKSLVTREEDNVLRVNFGKDLMAVLREVDKGHIRICSMTYRICAC